jgi:hypothetical protein
MRSPWIVALASFIPGLGFAIQSKMREAAISFVVVMAMLFVFVLAPWEIVSRASCDLLGLVWIGQGYLAFDAARRASRLESGAAIQARQQMPLPSPPAGLPRSKRLSFRAHRAVEQQLNPGEHVEAAVFATAMAGLGSHALWGAAAGLASKQYYVALTGTDLVFIQLDLWGKPAEVTRWPRGQIKSASLSTGLLTDSLTFDYAEGKPIKLKLPRNQREEAALISTAFRAQPAGEVS